ncbi:MAG TPA: nuclear transport factor 2 family protein [Candidatus Polarisedimenticolia bacterium]|nr:nuclear transport factor 2 family protein [Candidatus Polarisedimenticolia bacterium]
MGVRVLREWCLEAQAARFNPVPWHSFQTREVLHENQADCDSTAGRWSAQFGGENAARELEKQIRQLEDKVNGAYAANDLPAYFSYYAPDFSQWLPEGRTDLPTYQKDWTRFIQGGGRVESATYSDLHIQVGPSGDTAVASYILRVRTRSAKGEVSEEDNQESDVFFKRGGIWKIVFLHYCPAPKKKPQ